MFDVAATVVSINQDFDTIPVPALISAMRQRLCVLESEGESARESFGYCDEYETETNQLSVLPHITLTELAQNEAMAEVFSNFDANKYHETILALRGDSDLPEGTRICFLYDNLTYEDVADHLESYTQSNLALYKRILIGEFINK